MSIKYSYEIINVDEAARCMEIVYTSENRKTLHIGARLPYEDETVEDVIRAYAPVSYWKEQERPIKAPAKGLSGQVEVIPEVVEQKKVTKVTALVTNKVPSEPSPVDNPIYYDNYFLDLFKAETFLAGKGITGKTDYAVTMYNLSTNETIAHLYICKKQISDAIYGVKVLDGKVLEWYESGVTIDNVKYAYVSKDLVTDEVVDKYIFDQRGLVKVAPDTVEPTITRFGDFESIPHTIKPFLSGFEHRDKVSAWSLKPYGLVVEFSYS